MDTARVNPNGGAIGLGHPVGRNGRNSRDQDPERDGTRGPQAGARQPLHRRRPGNRNARRARLGDRLQPRFGEGEACLHCTMRRFHAMAPERFASVLSRGEYEALLGPGRASRTRVAWSSDLECELDREGRRCGRDVAPVAGLLSRRGRRRALGGDLRGSRISSPSRSGYTIVCTGLPGTAARWATPSARCTSRRWRRARGSWRSWCIRLDIVILHDPQTAGLAAAVRADGGDGDVALSRRSRRRQRSCS